MADDTQVEPRPFSVEDLKALGDAAGRVGSYVVFRHRKTGNKYGVCGFATNCTNAQDGTTMVLYAGLSNDVGEGFWTREANEFIEKFEYIGDAASEQAVRDACMRAILSAERTDNAG